MENMSTEVVRKLWGTEEVIVNNNLYCGKIFNITPGFRCSIHMHEQKTETFYVDSGVVELILWDMNYIQNAPTDPEIRQQYHLTRGESITIPAGTWHSFQALGTARVFEFSTPHSDADVQRARESTKA
jgi:mannose-6-phosphate isomerase-like protein (cupin superfamily)